MIARIALRTAAAFALPLALALAACSGGAGDAAHPSVLNFSILSAEDQASFQPLWTPLLNDLSRTVGVPVRPFFSSDYAALVQAMSADQTQVGWFSAQPALDAVERSKAQVFARTADLQGRETYTSEIIVKKGSPVTLDTVLACGKKLTFGMGDPKSTSGTLAPMAFLFAPRHIDPETCFKTVRSGTHNANLFAVANGVLDASTNNSVGLEWAQNGSDAAKSAFAKLQVVWQSQPLPESALVYRSDLDPALRRKIRDFFITYGKAPGAEGARQRSIMAALHYTAFNPAGDDYLNPIRQMQAAVNGK
jgi:phosphate/phosphite/phosphonate ABC transporter binding protein